MKFLIVLAIAVPWSLLAGFVTLIFHKVRSKPAPSPVSYNRVTELREKRDALVVDIETAKKRAGYKLIDADYVVGKAGNA